MQITHARTNDSLRRRLARQASLLGWLPVAAAIALSGCTTKKADAPDPTGPSELGPVAGASGVARRPGHGRRLAVDADHHRRATRTAPPAEHRRPRRGHGRRRDRRRPRPAVDQERHDRRRRPRHADLHGAEQRAEPEQRSRQRRASRCSRRRRGYDYRNAFSRDRSTSAWCRRASSCRSRAIAGAEVHVLADEPGRRTRTCIFDASTLDRRLRAGSRRSRTTRRSARRSAGPSRPTSGTSATARPAAACAPTTRFPTRGTYAVKLIVTNDRG